VYPFQLLTRLTYFYDTLKDSMYPLLTMTGLTGLMAVANVLCHWSRACQIWYKDNVAYVRIVYGILFVSQQNVATMGGL
jgi:hypothetical protein